VRLDWAGDRAAIGWIGQASAASTGAAHLRALDPEGRPSGGAYAVAGAGNATSLALRCRDGSCRVVIGRAEPSSSTLEIGALVWRPDGAPAPFGSVMAIPGIAPEDTSPVLVDDAVFFAEDNLKGQGRLRRLRMRWPPAP
jgi:hypothetical protein